MKFSKLQGLGNDFIIIDGRNKNYTAIQLETMAKVLCTRKKSIGADGLMVVENAEQADFKMLFYNADGSIGEMCGNGARCILRYAYDKGIVGKKAKFETKAGWIEGELLDESNVKIKLNLPCDIHKNLSVKEGEHSWNLSYLELGNPGVPHGLIKEEDLKENPLHIARRLRFAKEFPKGANINLYQKLGENLLQVRTYERGVEDFTLACGTGAASTAILCILNGVVKGPNVQIQMPGGVLEVEVREHLGEIREVYLIGETLFVCDGEAREF